MDSVHEHSQTTSQFTRCRERFYVTTAINYTNGPPHVGHAYEAVLTDSIARYHRIFGRSVFFLTGTDEHGQKVAKSAQSLGRSPQEHCDFYAQGFQQLNQRLNISNDFFVRTTSERHKRVARIVWDRVLRNGDLYVTKYEGWYDPYAEQYVTDVEAEKSDFKDSSGRPLERRASEEAYFFRMSKYQVSLISHINSHPHFIQPESRRNEILEFLNSQELRDLCVSRSNLKWGVDVPYDPKYDGNSHHVMYVWFDALTNYLSGCGCFAEDVETDVEARTGWWPNAVHIIGKDIVRFHTVYWPCMLMSANVQLPKCVFSHGFVSDARGQKMSKSLGNVVEPNSVLDSYPSDSLRWYLCSAAPFGSDLSFDEVKLVDSHNNVLLKSFGNLVRRACTLSEKYSGGAIDGVVEACPFDFRTLSDEFESFFSITGGFDVRSACEALYARIAETNSYLQSAEPWKSKDEIYRKNVVRTSLEAVYVLCHFLEPFCPTLARAAADRIGTPMKTVSELSWDFENLDVSNATFVGEVLVHEARAGEGCAIAASAAIVDKAALKKKKAQDLADARAAKLAKQKSQNVKSTVDDDRGAFGDVDFLKLEVRVGTILECSKHPDSDKLFCEKIDVGNGDVRDIASGLQKHYESPGDLVGLKCFVVTNLKPAKLAGFESNGMVLCYTTIDSTLRVLQAPPDTENGTRVSLKSLDGAEPPPGFNPKKVSKKKVLKSVLPHLKLKKGVAFCGDDQWTVQPVDFGACDSPIA